MTPGTRLGPYEIAAKIGEGGMGEVYRATDTRLGRSVAIKVLPASLAQDADRLARFDREARTLADQIAQGPMAIEDALPRLTQPFFRVEDARDYSSSGGGGLGLSIAQRAIQLHHGTLVAENAHPGLRVTLTLPDTAAGAA